jgi:hypothetical protein
MPIKPQNKSQDETSRARIQHREEKTRGRDHYNIAASTPHPLKQNLLLQKLKENATAGTTKHPQRSLKTPKQHNNTPSNIYV